ncbi:MAG: bactoprenol glucosyl transferase [Clostridiales bacterium GWE2_32_10]|nr:MAG: bactoprenol glucosyl transferase [Clostridiales bacterium GWE2_32_10]HBY20493.1 glycosyltransferase [Clostridiales bacterium]
MEKKLLSVVVPCYNEEKVLDLFYYELEKVLDKIEYEYEIIFVDDGSKDGTAEIIKKKNTLDKRISLVSFSRNFGKEAGIYAGLTYSKGDIVVVMDSDLQHQPEVIVDMIKYIEEGYDTVTTKRVDRKGENVIKKVFSNLFYRIMQKITDTELVQGAQDFRMMKRNVVDAILSLKEYNRFSKGIFSWVGFKVKYIEVKTIERAAGETKWSFSSLLKYAIEGILAFSTVPLRISTMVGILISIFSFGLLVQIIVKALFLGTDVPGYPSIMTAILFIGGIQLIVIGILSEYVAKIYYEIKARPKFIVRDYIASGQNGDGNIEN